MSSTTSPAVSGVRSPLRAGALLLALTFAVLACSLFTTQTQAHAYWWLAARAAPYILPAAAENAIAGVISGVVDVSGGSGSGGSGTGTGGNGGSGYESPKAQTAGRTGRLMELAGVLLGVGAFEFGWKLKDGQAVNYADAAPSAYPYLAPQLSACVAPPSGCVTFPGYNYTGPVRVRLANEVTLTTAHVASWWAYKDGALVASGANQNPTGVTGGNVSWYPAGTAWSNAISAGITGLVVTFVQSAGFTLGGGCSAHLVWGSAPGCVGQPAPTGTPGATPLTTTTTTTCSGGGGSATVIKYQPGSDTLPKITGGCPAGQVVTGITQTTKRDSDGATVPSPLGTGLQAPAVPSGYPECNPLGSCQLVLTRTFVDGAVQQCADSGICTGWSLQPRTGPKQTTKTATGTEVVTSARMFPDASYMTCKFGPYLVNNDDCITVPTEPVGPTPTTGQDPDNHCNFLLSKPWTWPYTALECAFVPSDGFFGGQLDGLQADYALTPPGVLIGVTTAFFGPIVDLAGTGPGDTDCLGPLVVIPLPAGPDLSIRPLNVCNELAQMVLDYWMPTASAGIYAAALFGAHRSLGRALGIEAPLVKASSA